MTDDLKTKIAEAMLEALRSGNGKNEEDRCAEAALQAIHDAGFAVVPREPTEAIIEAGCKQTLPAMFKHGIHGFARDGEGTRRQMAAVILDVEKKYAAMIKAAGAQS